MGFRETFTLLKRGVFKEASVMPFALEPFPGDVDLRGSQPGPQCPLVPPGWTSSYTCSYFNRMTTFEPPVYARPLVSFLQHLTGHQIIPQRPLLKAQPLPSLMRKSNHWEGK